jgi:hypothetical protein
MMARNGSGNVRSREGEGEREQLGRQPLNEPVAPEFEYFSPYEPTRQRVPVLAGEGVDLRFNNQGDSLIYELKVPLRSSSKHPYSAEAAAGMKIAVGFNVSFERPQGGTPDGGGGFGGGGSAPGGRGGRGGRTGGGRGGMGGGRGGEVGGQRPGGTGMDPLSIWVVVQLAEGKSTIRNH